MTKELEEIKQRQDQLEDYIYVLESRLSTQEGLMGQGPGTIPIRRPAWRRRCRVGR